MMEYPPVPSYYAASANSAPVRPALRGSCEADVCVVGAGYTGLSTALFLAEAGFRVVVLEAATVGWGASGRNGGQIVNSFSRDLDKALDRKFGRDSRIAFRQAELAAVKMVEPLATEHNIEIDRHSEGETELAHRPKEMAALRARVPEIKENYGLDATLIEKRELAAQGLSGDFQGALTIPAGLAFNSTKICDGPRCCGRTGRRSHLPQHNGAKHRQDIQRVPSSDKNRVCQSEEPACRDERIFLGRYARLAGGPIYACAIQRDCNPSADRRRDQRRRLV